MRALQISAFGVPTEVVTLTDIPEPAAPAPDEVLVQVEYSPLNFHDLTFIGGYLVTSPLPATPGNEGVAHVLAVGSDVSNVAVGDTVVLPLLAGAWRELLTVPAKGLFPLPDIDIVQLSMLGSNTPTAGLMLSEYATLSSGDWVIQDAANGGVGLNVIALAKLRGLRTINIVRSEEAAAVVRHAGGDIVEVERADVASDIRARIGDVPVKLGIDSVGGATAGILLDVLSPGATLVSYGTASGEAISPDNQLVQEKGITASSIFVGAFDNVEKIVPVIKEVVPLIADGSLVVPVAEIFPLEQFRDALSRLQQGGKVILEVTKAQE